MHIYLIHGPQIMACCTFTGDLGFTVVVFAFVAADEAALLVARVTALQVTGFFG